MPLEAWHGGGKTLGKPDIGLGGLRVARGMVVLQIVVDGFRLPHHGLEVSDPFTEKTRANRLPGFLHKRNSTRREP